MVLSLKSTGKFYLTKNETVSLCPDVSQMEYILYLFSQDNAEFQIIQCSIHTISFDLANCLLFGPVYLKNLLFILQPISMDIQTNNPWIFFDQRPNHFTGKICNYNTQPWYWNSLSLLISCSLSLLIFRSLYKAYLFTQIFIQKRWFLVS